MRKNILIIIFLGIGILACNTQVDNNVPIERYKYTKNYFGPRPQDIPDTLCDGTRVYWDGSWQSAYNDNRVTTKKKDGCECYIWVAKSKEKRKRGRKD